MTTAPSAVSLAMRPSQAVGLAGSRWWGGGTAGRGPRRRTAIGVRACCPDQVVVCKLHVSSSPRTLPPCPDLHLRSHPCYCSAFAHTVIPACTGLASNHHLSCCSFIHPCMQSAVVQLPCCAAKDWFTLGIPAQHCCKDVKACEISCACCWAYLDLSSAKRARGLEASGACLDMVVSGRLG